MDIQKLGDNTYAQKKTEKVIIMSQQQKALSSSVGKEVEEETDVTRT